MLMRALPAFAQGVGGSPCENAVNVLRNSFTGTIATGLSVFAIVVGGLTLPMAKSLQEGARRHHLWGRHGDQRRELHGLAVSGRLIKDRHGRGRRKAKSSV
jgi:hypothetical protein